MAQRFDDKTPMEIFETIDGRCNLRFQFGSKQQEQMLDVMEACNRMWEKAGEQTLKKVQQERADREAKEQEDIKVQQEIAQGLRDEEGKPVKTEEPKKEAPKAKAKAKKVASGN